MQPIKHIIVTGGTGYIGSHLIRRALAEGLYVTLLCRKAPWNGSPDRLRTFLWQLPDPPPDAFFAASDGFPSADALIHLSHQWDGNESIPEDINVIGTMALAGAARRNEIRRIVFGSSVSARADALNRYGRIKWTIEQALATPDALVARIGLVYGGTPLGQWGKIFRLLRSLPILPVPGAGKSVQPIHVDEVCDGLLRMAAIEDPRRAIYGLASSVPIPFERFLRIVSHSIGRRGILLVPIAVSSVLLALKILRVVPFLRVIDEERIRGIAGIRPIETRSDLEELGIHIGSVTDGLANDGLLNRRRLVAEGRAIGRYLFGQRPPMGFVKRYVKAVCHHDGGRPIHLPALAMGWPATIRFIDPLPVRIDAEHTDNGLQRRLQLGTIILEASREGAGFIFDYEGIGLISALLGLLMIAAGEAFSLPIRLIMGRQDRQ